MLLRLSPVYLWYASYSAVRWRLHDTSMRRGARPPVPPGAWGSGVKVTRAALLLFSLCVYALLPRPPPDRSATGIR